MSVRGNRELGSVVTFFIIGIVLVAVTIGTIAVVVNRGEQARKEQAIAASNKQVAQNNQNAQNAANAAKAAAASSAAASNTAATKPQASTAGTSTALPTTGTELDVVRILAIGLLVGTTTAFVLSRRGLKRSL